MKQTCKTKELCAPRHQAGLTLVEVVVAVSIATLASLMLYPVFSLANSMIIANQQKLEAESVAMDRILEIFNTTDFKAILLATNLPPMPTPSFSLLPSNTEFRAMIVPNAGTNAPYKWDVEVRVKRDTFRAGGRKVVLTNDIVYRVTRYDVERN